MAFPSTLDSFTTKYDGVSDVLAADINNLQAAVLALETKVGINNSTDASSLDYKTVHGDWTGMTWQTASSLGGRSAGTTYTNSTGKAIMVAVTAYSNMAGTGSSFSYGDVYAYVNGLNIVQSSGTSAGSDQPGGVTFIVPPGATYRVDIGGSLSIWTELR